MIYNTIDTKTRTPGRFESDTMSLSFTALVQTTERPDHFLQQHSIDSLKHPAVVGSTSVSVRRRFCFPSRLRTSFFDDRPWMLSQSSWACQLSTPPIEPHPSSRDVSQGPTALRRVGSASARSSSASQSRFCETVDPRLLGARSDPDASAACASGSSRGATANPSVCFDATSFRFSETKGGVTGRGTFPCRTLDRSSLFCASRSTDLKYIELIFRPLVICTTALYGQHGLPEGAANQRTDVARSELHPFTQLWRRRRRDVVKPVVIPVECIRRRCLLMSGDPAHIVDVRGRRQMCGGHLGGGGNE